MAGKDTTPMTVYDLMAMVAKRLVGRDVELRFTPAAELKAGGCVRVGADGHRVVELATDHGGAWDGDMHAFLHELAHARFHAPKFKRSDTGRPPRWREPALKTKRTILQEAQADTMARYWLKWADEHRQDIPGATDYENRLWALTHWRA